jgi:hypothetical protein
MIKHKSKSQELAVMQEEIKEIGDVKEVFINEIINKYSKKKEQTDQ